VARTPRAAAPPAVKAMTFSGQWAFLGPDGLAWGRSGIGVGPSGSAQKGRLDFFFS
jgi:hypothetical protein